MNVWILLPIGDIITINMMFYNQSVDVVDWSKVDKEDYLLPCFQDGRTKRKVK